MNSIITIFHDPVGFNQFINPPSRAICVNKNLKRFQEEAGGQYRDWRPGLWPGLTPICLIVMDQRLVSLR